MANGITPNPNDNTYQRYLANQFGSGVDAHLSDQGTHTVVDGVIAAYAAAGQQVPASINGQLQELRDIARSEFELKNASPSAREALNFGGAYDPLAVGRRERELVGIISNATQGVYVKPADIADAQNRQALAEANAAATVAGQKVRQNEQALALGEIQLQSARLTAEANDASARGLAAETAREAAAQAVLDTLGDVSTFDMMNALNADNPALAQEVFGQGTTRDVQLKAMTLRLAEENAAIQAQGGGTAVGASQGSRSDAITAMGALEMQRSNSIIETYGADLAGMADGTIALPDGVQLREVQKAFNLQQARQIDANQLTVDLINDRLDVDGVAGAGTNGAREDKVDTAFRLLTTMSHADLGAVAAAAEAGQPITLPVPNSDMTLTLNPAQATAALQRVEAGFVATAQAGALASLNQDLVNSYGQELGRLETSIRNATNGAIPQSVQAVLAAEKAALGNVAYGDGNVDDLNGAIGRVEEAMIKAGMTEDQITAAIYDRFANDGQVATGAVNVLSRSPDPQLFSPVTNAFLAQLENRAKTSDHPLTPDRLAELRTIMMDTTITGEEASARMQDVLGYPVQELRGMMQAAVTGAVFNNGFGDFMAKMVAGPDEGGLGLLGSAEGASLTADLQAAIRDKIQRGEPFDAESYTQTVQTLASAYTTNNADRDKIMGVFYDSLRSASSGDLFRRFDGTVSQDETALFAMINGMTSGSPISGRNSVPVSELPDVMAAQIDQQIQQTVLGHQRFDVPNQQTQVLSYAVGQLLGINTQDGFSGMTIIPPNIGNNPQMLEQNLPISSQVDVLNRPIGGLAREQQVLDLNPQLTRFVASYVMPRIVGAAERETNWYDFLTFGRIITLEEQAAALSGVDFNELQRLASERGLLGGQ